jgi:hypothetical protein
MVAPSMDEATIFNSTQKEVFTMECNHMFSYPGSCSHVEAGADLSAIWTSFATLAMSREMSNALAEAPITITTY